MSLKGVTAINKILNTFLNEFNNITADMGTDFCYWYDDKLIHYTVIVAEADNEYFMNNFNRLAPDIKCDPFLACFLHEVGHATTLDNISDLEMSYCADCKQRMADRLAALDENETNKQKEIYQEYFELPDEYKATMWAIEYIRNNTMKVMTLWNELQNAIIEFYQMNGIEGI